MNDAAAAIIRDLRILSDQGRWAHTHGYVKEGHGLDREHGADLSKSEQERMKGPRYDLELGSHPARVAYQHAVRAVSAADLLLAAVLYAQGTTTQPVLTPVSLYDRPDAFAGRIVRAIWRAERVTADPRLAAVRKALDQAVRGMSKALDAGTPDGIAHGERPCITCKIRPQAEREKADGTMRAHKAGECDVCAQYRYRNGTPRPTKLDSGPVNEARAAQQRRLQRGESWGVA